MRRNFVLTLIFLGLCGTARSQDESLTMLTQAAHCMVTAGRDTHKVLHGNPKALNLGSHGDTTSYPGEQALYIVDYQDSKLSKGLVFVYFVSERKGQRIFRFENNATFIRKKKEIEFTEPPLGGVWTQEHMEAAIDRIEKQPRVELTVKDLRGSFPGVRCESYADPQ
jgi:hypothetical protein